MRTGPIHWRLVGLGMLLAGCAGGGIMAAVDRGDLVAVRKIVSGSREAMQAPDEYGCPVLRRAIRENKLEIAEYLVEAGVNVNESGTCSPALLSAIENGWTALARKLIDAGADVNGRDKSSTPLLAVIENPFLGRETKFDPALFRLLIDKGADLRALDHNNNDALHLAAGRGLTDALAVLIERGWT